MFSIFSSNKPDPTASAISIVPVQGTVAPVQGTAGTQAPLNNPTAIEITKEYDPVKDQGRISKMITTVPDAVNPKTAALGMMAAVTAASMAALQFSVDNSGSLKAAAMGAKNIPMVGAVMAPLVMIAILLEMEKLNQSLRVFLFKINHVLKQMLNTVKLITEVSIDFDIVLNQPALDGITSELAELTEILALYYKVYADSAKSGSATPGSAAPSSTLNRFTSSVKSAASKVGSFASRMANKLNTFASVQANKSKALDNIVIANMYFNMLFSQMEFQLKMKTQDPNYITKLENLNKSEAYKAISSGTPPTAIDAKLDNLIKNLKDDPKVVAAADKTGDAAEIKELKEAVVAGEHSETERTGGAINHRRRVEAYTSFPASFPKGTGLRPPPLWSITETNIDPMSVPFIVDRIVHFFQIQILPTSSRKRIGRSRRHRSRRHRTRSHRNVSKRK